MPRSADKVLFKQNLLRRVLQFVADVGQDLVCFELIFLNCDQIVLEDQGSEFKALLQNKQFKRCTR